MRGGNSEWITIFFISLFLFSKASNTVKSTTSITVVNGYVGHQYVGFHTSELQKNVIDKLFQDVTKANWSQTSLVNSTILRYLNLQGTYYADVPLLLPSLFVLNLTSGSLFDAVNLSSSPLNGDSKAVPGLITLNQTIYSAVIGGIINATVHKETKMHAISLLNSNRNTVRKVRALAHWRSALAIHGGSKNEISKCNAGGDEGRTIPVRALWCLATSHAYIHHNYIHHSESHALDFDAYTGNSICWNNLCEDNSAEGIFVEETAHDNVVVGNTCRRNKHGIGVYSEAVGPVKNNVFFGNFLYNNTINGIIAGGAGHNSNKHSESNVFFSNTASGNADGTTDGQFNPAHGINIGDFWFNNVVDEKDETKFFPLPMSNVNTSMFDPEM